MSILSELTEIFEGLNIPVETGVFSEKAPDSYVVLTPLTDIFELHADNYPQIDINEIRISLFSKNNYSELKNSIIKKLLARDFTISARFYAGHDDESGFHNFAIDVLKFNEEE